MQQMPEENTVTGQITLFLRRLSAGDSSAETPLAEAVYSEIRAAATQYETARGRGYISGDGAVGR